MTSELLWWAILDYSANRRGK